MNANKDVKIRLYNRIKEYNGFPNTKAVKDSIFEEIKEEIGNIISEIDGRDGIYKNPKKLG